MSNNISDGNNGFFSIRGVFATRHLAVMAMLLAVRTILGLPFLTIYISGVKLVTLAYLCDAATAMLYGPWAALAFGFAGDTLGYFATMGGGGAYMPVFAISEMITGFIFAIFLYRQEVKLSRIVIAWTLNLLVVVLGLNSLWLILMFGIKAGKVFTLMRVGINLIQFPVHILLTFFALRAIRKIDSLFSR